jgi:hypothetical protein
LQIVSEIGVSTPCKQTGERETESTRGPGEQLACGKFFSS